MCWAAHFYAVALPKSTVAMLGTVTVVIVDLDGMVFVTVGRRTGSNPGAWLYESGQTRS